jgi:hypothetical protein
MMFKAKYVFCIMLVLISLSFMGIRICSAQSNNREPPAILSTTTIKAINPSQVDVNQLLVVNVSVIDVTDLFAWQIKLAYNVTVMNFTRAWYPSDHVFAGKQYFGLPAEAQYDVDAQSWYVLYACTLLNPEPGFTGSGALCQIEFNTTALGESYLNFLYPKADTVLLNSTQGDIEFVLLNSSVKVVPEFSSYFVPSFFLVITAVIVCFAKFLPRKNVKHIPNK